MVYLLPSSKTGLTGHLFSRAFPDHPTFKGPKPSPCHLVLKSSLLCSFLGHESKLKPALQRNIGAQT